TVLLSTQNTGPVEGPKDFDIVVHFTTPFIYNPAEGNLLLDVSSFTQAFFVAMDAENTPGDSVSRVFQFPVDATVAQPQDSYGLVTQFVYTPISAPAYGVQTLYDGTRPVKSGAVMPIKLRILDVSGVNVSSASLVVQATAINRVAATADGVLQDAGNANPDFN